MFCTVIIFFTLLFGSIAARSFDAKVVNGTDAVDKEFPYAVSVRYFDRHSCGGSIISEMWILTAGHCVLKSIVENATILFGTVNLHLGEHPENYTRRIKNAIIHPNFTYVVGIPNDVALLELEYPVVFNEYVQPVKLIELWAETPANHTGTLVGWGLNDTYANVMNTLQKVELLVYSNNACFEAHNELFNPEVHVCAGVPEGGKGQCSGDSGGPLICDGVQIGTVSWSVKPCTIKGYPGVYARVASYRRWIYELTGV